MIKYILTKPLKHGDKQLTCVEMHAPTVRHMPLISKIKEGYNKAQLDMLQRLKTSGIDVNTDTPTGNVEEPTEEEVAESIKGVLNTACVGTDQIYEHMKALLLSSGICQIGNDDGNLKKIEVGNIDRLTLDDYIGITASYIGGFIAPVSK